VAYIGKMFWPTRLAVLYPYPRSLPSWWVIGSVVILLGVSVVALRLARRAPYLPVGWFWYVGTLVPVIGLVQVGSQSMAADRYTYVPLIGLFIVLAWGIPDLLGRRYPRSALPVAAALAIVACAILAGRQVRYWANTEVLWTRAVEVTSANYQAHNDLGNILAAQGRVEAAAAHFAEALRLRPDFVEAHNNLGFTLARLGRTDEAMAHFAEALRLRPTYAEAHNNLGLALAAHGRADEAIREFREALRLKPDAAETHVNVAVLLARQGQADEAVRHYAEAIRLEPAAPDAHYLLGQLLADQGNVEDAARHLETALRLNPRLLKARQALGELAARRAGTAPRPR
jgi:tetratricopeptide (TPR) repeat protein